jgi:hypothetical protein
MAWTIEIHLHRRILIEDCSYYDAKVYLEDGGWLLWRFKAMSEADLVPGQVCTGIILGQDVDSDLTAPAVLVVSKVGDTIERICLDYIDQGHCERWNKDGTLMSEDKGRYDILYSKCPSLVKPRELVKSWAEVRLG